MTSSKTFSESCSDSLQNGNHGEYSVKAPLNLFFLQPFNRPIDPLSAMGNDTFNFIRMATMQIIEATQAERRSKL